MLLSRHATSPTKESTSKCKTGRLGKPDPIRFSQIMSTKEVTENDVLTLDAEDGLGRFRDQFSIPQGIYLDGETNLSYLQTVKAMHYIAMESRWTSHIQDERDGPICRKQPWVLTKSHFASHQRGQQAHNLPLPAK